MKNLNLAWAALLAIGIIGCKKEENAPDDHMLAEEASVTMRFNLRHGLNSFDINQDYTDGFGHAVRFTTLKFYASDFVLQDDAGGTMADFTGKAMLIDGINPSSAYTIGNMRHGHIHQVHFNLGLDSATNHADPTMAPYPLNIPGMHWSWNPAAGYKFLNMEGHVDGNGDGDYDDVDDKVFTYHCATDALLREDHVHFHADVHSGSVTVEAKVDVAILLMGLDLLTNSVAMGGGLANVMAMDNLSAAIDEL